MNDDFIRKCKNIKLSKQIYLKVLLQENRDCLDKIAEELYTKVGIIELNGENISPKSFLEIAQKTKQLCAQFDKTLIIKDRLDITAIVEADGIFLTSVDIPQNYVYEFLSKQTIIGTDDINNLNADYYLINSNTKQKNTKSCFIKFNVCDNFEYYTLINSN